MKNNLKCKKCHRDATMHTPYYSCDLHWVLENTKDWDKIDPELAKVERIAALQEIWEKYSKPHDANSQIKAVKKG